MNGCINTALLIARLHAESLIDSLDDDLQQVFRLHWISGKRWEEIQEQLSYSSLKLKRVKFSIPSQLAVIFGGIAWIKTRIKKA